MWFLGYVWGKVLIYVKVNKMHFTFGIISISYEKDVGENLNSSLASFLIYIA